MALVMVVGAKGGVGTSLLAASLASELARVSQCILFDGTPVSGSIDLLLGLKAERNWAELMPVAGELSERQLDLVSSIGQAGLRFLAAPRQFNAENPAMLFDSLVGYCDWLMVDLPLQWLARHRELRQMALVTLIVTTLDPPALRACKRWLDLVKADMAGSIRLIVNQWQPHHPVDPAALADSLSIPLAGVIPYAPQEVAERIHFGQQAEAADGSELQLAVQRLAETLTGTVASQELNPAT